MDQETSAEFEGHWAAKKKDPCGPAKPAEPHHPFTHEQATPSGDFLEKNHENLS